MIHSGSRKKQDNLTMLAENVQPRPATPTLQGPSTAPVVPILLKFWLNTRNSPLNSQKVSNLYAQQFSSGNQKPSWQNLPPPPARNRIMLSGLVSLDAAHRTRVLGLFGS